MSWFPKHGPLPKNPDGAYGLLRVHLSSPCPVCGEATELHIKDWQQPSSCGILWLYVWCNGTRAKC